ncbi:hypothetical protein MRX96_038313 [Rhipicephalus microplus]
MSRNWGSYARPRQAGYRHLRFAASLVTRSSFEKTDISTNIRSQRASEESLASADDSIEETHSVMSFIMSRLPDHASVLPEEVDAVSSGLVAGLATASTTTLAYGLPCGDGAPALPPLFPVEVRKHHIRWVALIAYLPRLLRLILLLVAHATLLVAFFEVGWDKNVRYEPKRASNNLVLNNAP